MDPQKIEVVVSWKPPKNVSDVRSFLDLTGYYKKSVEGFSRIAAPLTKLTRKDVKYDWVELPYTRLRACSSRVCIKYMEALLIWCSL